LSLEMHIVRPLLDGRSAWDLDELQMTPFLTRPGSFSTVVEREETTWADRMTSGSDEDEVGEGELMGCGRERLGFVLLRAEQHVFREDSVLSVSLDPLRSVRYVLC
jgi:hypothetical protein